MQGRFMRCRCWRRSLQTDMTQVQDEKAMAVLKPLFVKDPDNPGVVHYIIHSCDNPRDGEGWFGGGGPLW